ncbi:MAG: ZIP family metal transporter [Candidatus Bathyarchaeia archaeon]
MYTLILILTAVTVVSLLSLIGIIFVGLNERSLKALLTALVGLASGALIGGAFIHLLPEAVETVGSGILQYTILGILFFFILEKLLWRHCHEGKCPTHVFGYLNLVGDGVHNFIDGMIIAISFIASTGLGVATTTAVIIHEIPQEIGDFGVLVYSGFEKRKALLLNFLSALIAIAGATFTFFWTGFFGESVLKWLIPFAAGGFIYVAATDLMPELHKKTEARESIIQLAMILLGLASLWSIKFLFV